jgi:hypothetical protein
MESEIRTAMLRLRTIVTEEKKQKSFPGVPKHAIVEPEDERSEITEMAPEQVDRKDEIEYDQIRSAENDMDGDDNPDLDPEA